MNKPRPQACNSQIKEDSSGTVVVQELSKWKSGGPELFEGFWLLL